jgi:hypothetical protein
MEYLHKHYPDATYFDCPYEGRSGYTQSGYGKRLPTHYMVRIGSRNHRLYCMCWSNIGTCWVKVKGKQYIFEDCYHKKVSTPQEGQCHQQ